MAWCKLDCKMLLLEGVVGLLSLNSCGEQAISNPIIPIDKIEQSDIVFRRGEGLVSDVVLHADADGLYSHIGVVVKHNDSLKVVHSVPGEGDFDGVKMESIEKFFASNRAQKGEVARMDLNEMQRNKISRLAIKKSEEKVAFDYDYNLDDTTQLYCTELIVLLYKQIGIDIAQGRSTRVDLPGMSGDYVMPSDIYKNKKLISIYKF